jgi:hypothetical protein
LFYQLPELAAKQLTRRRTDEAVEEFQRALDLNPNFAAAHAISACARARRPIGAGDRSYRAGDPHEPARSQNALFNVAAAHYLSGLNRSAQLQPQGHATAFRIDQWTIEFTSRCLDRTKHPLYARPDGKIPRRHAQSRAGIDPRYGLVEFKTAKPPDVISAD